MTYHLEGKLLEVCNCNAICPCWVGEDPDNGTCEGLLAWHFESGTIDGVDVSGLTLAVLAHIPGNVLAGNWRAVVFMDDKATDQQEEAILNVYTGKLGGPVADLVQLIGEVIGVERVPIHFNVEKGKGSLRVGSAIEADVEAFQGGTGGTTALSDAVFSTIPGSPAFVGKAAKYKASHAGLGMNIDLQGKNSVQGSFRFEAA